jgi:glycine/D-amino acid oxidase-like deaminating enzyme
MDNKSGGIVVVGAGVVGMAIALYLRRAGQPVSVLDPLPPAGGASYGNAGLISADTAVPIAMPGMLRKVPKWLSDPMGPLTVRPSYFPLALPWLMRWMKAGRMENVMRISDALRALHKDALVCWRELLGEARFGELIREVGQVRVWEGESMGARKFEVDLCRRHGIEVQELDNQALREMYPEIAPDVTEGLLLPGNAFTVSPSRLVRTLGELLVEAGGRIVSQRVAKILPQGGAGFLLMTNEESRVAERVIVAAGAWSMRLLKPLGLSLPLETERGYHAMMPSPNIELKRPLSVKNRGFGLTPMETGWCAAGTVEIAGLDAPPNERRAMILAQHAKRLFPSLRTGEPTYWMGFRPSTPDSLPILGEAPGIPGLYLAFGHGHFGLTGGTPSARLVSQLVTGAKPAIDPTPYASARFA